MKGIGKNKYILSEVRDMAENGRYTPTTAEEKLLEVLLNPKNRGKTIAEISAMAGIGERTYYRAIEKPEFIDYYNNLI